MSKILISCDPGVSNGLSLWTYSDTDYARCQIFSQFRGGAEALIKKAYEWKDRFPDAHWICEDFTARSTQGFRYTTASLEPLVGIGALVAMGLIDRSDRNQMCAPPMQYFVPGKNKAEKKKAQHKWLKDHGLYVAPKDVDSPDSDDVRSSMAHAISWFRRQKHLPTIRHYFPEGENDD